MCFTNILYIYIYIYIEGEGERKRSLQGCMATFVRCRTSEKMAGNPRAASWMACWVPRMQKCASRRRPKLLSAPGVLYVVHSL